MTEIRCVKCRRLLFKVDPYEGFGIEIKCPKCGYVNKLNIGEDEKVESIE